MKNGISLIVLIITIIIIIILAGAVILNLSNNNPIDNAKIANLTQHKESLDSAMTLYLSKQTTKTLGEYSASDIINGKSPDMPKLIDTEDGISINGVSVYLVKEDVIAQELNISLENKENSKWYIDPLTGKFYLVYDNKESYDGYLGNYDEATGNLENKTISQFVIAKSLNDYDEIKGVNRPRLVAGMKPIKWDTSGNVVETNENDPEWYDYTSKKWANARTEDGSMWVWIPKYEYKMQTSHTSNAQIIDVKFMIGTNSVGSDGYTIHPAFRFGYEDLSGIWVAKFEASGNTSSIDIKPGVASLRNLTMDSMFAACRNMEENLRYGWGSTGKSIDTHLMKNIEWGAVAYLSSSTYGKTGEIWINPNSNYLTGQAGSSVNSSGTTSTNGYNTANGVNASTTGNVYGIYDMSGGALEYVAAYINNNNINLTAYGQTLLDADSRYKDVYSIGASDTRPLNYLSNAHKKGDAVYETSVNPESDGSSWYEDMSYMPYTYFPFFIRGGYYNNSNFAGIFAYCDYTAGSPYEGASFRPVLVISSVQE